MRYPEFLGQNGCIGFVAPAFGCSTEPYKSGFIAAQDRFKKMGYSIKLGPNCYESSGIGISNTPDKCGAELNSFYTDSGIDVLLSCGGGELMCEVVPYIDFEAVKNADPKWYMGYSDNTNFTFLSATLADTAALYGPSAAAFGMNPWHKAIQDAVDVLTGEACHDGIISLNGYDKWETESLKDDEHPYEPYNTTENTRIISLHEGRIEDTVDGIPLSTGDIHMSGRFIGGCMDCLVQLIGTPFDKVEEFTDRYADDGIIWFMESCDLGPMDVRRAMWHMRQAGWFKNIKGMVIGRPYRYGESFGELNMYRAVVDIISDLAIPIVMDVDIGHHPPMLPVICGSFAEIETDGEKYTLTMHLR
ncbi:MAG: LD-carboxypeptidase [Lachnospiraceae bacterium]|nr:LD-carboxypeptidase [Lachnospiraceae bacterium]